MRPKPLPLRATPPQCNVRFFRSLHRNEFTISSLEAQSNDLSQSKIINIPISSQWKIPARNFLNTTSASSSAPVPFSSIDDYNDMSSDDNLSPHTHKVIYESYPESHLNLSQPSLLPQQRATTTLLDSKMTPLGSFTPSTMERAEDLFHFWIEQFAISPSSSHELYKHHHPSIQGTIKATQILYRVLDEMESGNSHAYVNIQMIDALLHHWTQRITAINTTDWQTRHEQLKLSTEVIEQLVHKLQNVLDDDTMPYKTLIKSLSKIPYPSAANTAEELLNIMLQSRTTVGGVGIEKHVSLLKDTEPDLVCFNMVLASWSNVSLEYVKFSCGGNRDSLSKDEAIGIEAGNRALGVLNKMKKIFRAGDQDVQPNLISFDLTIRALLRSAELEKPCLDGNDDPEFSAKPGKNRDIAVYQAYAQLQEMIKMYIASCDQGITDLSIRPDKVLFNTVINALGKLEVVDGSTTHAEQALILLHQMKELRILPDTLTYNLIIGAFLRQSSLCRYSNHTKVNRLNQNKDQRKSKVVVDIIKELITFMKTEESSKPDHVTYNCLIKAYANVGDAHMAASTLRWMIDQCNENDYELKDDFRNKTRYHRLQPTTTSWNSVIEAICKSDGKDTVEKAMRILHDMQCYNKERKELRRNTELSSFQDDEFDCEPDKISISLIISALVRSSTRGDRHAVRQALQILDRIESISTQDENSLMKPDVIMYTSIMDCIAKSNHPMKGKIAMDLLQRMSLHNSGKDLKPDTVAYNTVLYALTTSSSGKGNTKCTMREAEQLLNVMEASDDRFIAPNTVSYSTVISGWAKSKDVGAANAAVRLLRRMESLSVENNRVKPNTISYASTLNALAHNRYNGTSKIATEILQQMEDRFAKGEEDVRPNAYTYSSAIMAVANCLDKDNIAPEVQKILQRMIVKSRDSNPDASPNTVVFNSVIKAIEKSAVRNKASEAQNILELMKERLVSDKARSAYASPNTRTYNGILRCCAFTNGSEEENQVAFETALKTLNELRNSKHCSVDMYTYPAMFKACERLLRGTHREHRDWHVEGKDGNLEKIREVFSMCCKDGLVDSLVLQNLTNFLKGETMHSLLQISEEKKGNKVTNSQPFSIMKTQSLPKSWCRNVNIRRNRRENQYKKRNR